MKRHTIHTRSGQKIPDKKNGIHYHTYLTNRLPSTTYHNPFYWHTTVSTSRVSHHSVNHLIWLNWKSDDEPDNKEQTQRFQTSSASAASSTNFANDKFWTISIITIFSPDAFTLFIELFSEICVELTKGIVKERVILVLGSDCCCRHAISMYSVSRELLRPPVHYTYAFNIISFCIY